MGHSGIFRDYPLRSTKLRAITSISLAPFSLNDSGREARATVAELLQEGSLGANVKSTTELHC